MQWECKKCRAKNSDFYDVCGNCGTLQNGTSLFTTISIGVLLLLALLAIAIVTVNSNKEQKIVPKSKKGK